MGDERQRAATDERVATVLVVDDRPRPLLLDAIFSGEGYRVRNARNAAEALDRLLHEDIDVLVVDQRLLGPGGELIQRARLYDCLLPVIVQCGVLGARERRCLMRELQLHGIHPRDGDASQLIELVESALAARRRGARAEAAQELQDVIAARLGHDLLTALQVIRGYTEVLRSEPAPPATEEILQRLERAGDDALAWAQDYLDLASTDALAASSRYARVDVNALLDDLQTYARRQIGERPLRFVVVAPPLGTCLYTDGERLDALLSHLVADAVQHSRAGDLRLTVRLQRASVDFVLVDTRPGPSLRPQNDDLGSGIPAQGIELAMARRLSTFLGAPLTAQPAHPCGIRFTLRVPLQTVSSVPIGVTLH